jgi:hypothetical protein
MSHRSSLCTVLLAIFMLFAGLGNAQDIRSLSQGFSVQLFGKYDNWKSNSFFLGDIPDNEPNGRGLGMKLAYGLTNSFELNIAYDYTNFNLLKDWDVYRTEVYSLGFQYNFGASRQYARPYLMGGISSNNLKLEEVYIQVDSMLVYDDAEMIMKGLSGNVGLGLKLYPIPQLAVDLGLIGRFGNFTSTLVNTNPYKQEEVIDFRFFTIKLGVSYYLF